MSELRIPDVQASVRLPRKHGKIRHKKVPSVKFELYGAYQFKHNHRRLDRNFRPSVPLPHDKRAVWYKTMYRIRINEVWYSPGPEQYHFFTIEESWRLVVSGAAK